LRWCRRGWAGRQGRDCSAPPAGDDEPV